MNALPTSDRKYVSSASKNALRPSLKRLRWVCIPEPFSPKSGLGMNVACQPYFMAYSLTVMRYVMQSSAIFSASA
jgi:hypothetical protein